MTTIGIGPVDKKSRKLRSIVNDLWKEKFVVPRKEELAEIFDRSSYCETVRSGLARAWKESGGNPNELYAMRLPDDFILLVYGTPQRLVG